jgi:hypothetical protein
MTVGAIADPVEAIAEFLREEMGEKVEGRIFRPELPQPDELAVADFKSAIVVTRAGKAGKLFAGTRLPVKDSHVTVYCYGSERQEADEIAALASEYLRLLSYAYPECRVAEGTVLMHWARVTSDLIPRVHPDTNWPYAEFTVQLMHSQCVLPA